MTASPRAVLGWATAAQAATSLMNFGLPAIGPQLGKEFGLGLASLGAVLTASLLGSGLALIPASKAVDRAGARATTIAGGALASGALAAAAFARSGAVLMALLVLAGLGMAAIPIAGMAGVFRVFPPARRGWALGVRQVGVPVGGVLGAALLPALDSVGGVKAALLFCAVVNGATALVFALVSGDARPAAPPRAGLRRVFATPGIVRLLVVAAFYIVVLQSLIAYLVPSARAAGLSPFLAGAAYLVLNVTAGIARISWGRLADRHGGTRRVRMLVGAGWVAAAGAALFTLALHVGAVAILPASVLFAFGALGWNALVYVTAGERAHPELTGQSVAVAATLIFLLSAACTPPMGALADHAGWDVLWITTGVLAAAGALVAAGLHRTQREPVPT